MARQRGQQARASSDRDPIEQYQPAFKRIDAIWARPQAAQRKNEALAGPEHRWGAGAGPRFAPSWLPIPASSRQGAGWGERGCGREAFEQARFAGAGAQIVHNYLALDDAMSLQAVASSLQAGLQQGWGGAAAAIRGCVGPQAA